MDKEKARVVLARALQPYRAKSYAELRGLIGQVDAHEVANPDGPDFQVEIEAFWDHRPDGNICVSGASTTADGRPSRHYATTSSWRQTVRWSANDWVAQGDSSTTNRNTRRVDSISRSSR